MTKSQLVPMLLLFAAAACSDTADTTPDTARVPDTSETASAAPGPSSATCGISSGSVLTGDGIGRLRIGATLAEVREECAVVADTTGLDLEGMQQRRVKVEVRRDTIEALIVDDRVWRINVDESAFRTPEGLGVGSTVAEVREGRTAHVMPGEGSMYLTVTDHCGLSFRLSGVQFGRARPAAELPANGRVVEVLAFGCDSTQP